MRRLARYAMIPPLLLLLSAPSWAKNAPAPEPNNRALGIAGDVGFGGMAGTAYTTLQSGIDVREGNLSLGLFGRVRIVMQEDNDGSAVRGRDWDEVSDYVHILRYLRYRRTFYSKTLGPVRLAAQAGEILGYTLGHGTLIRDYSNVADPDHPHAGMHLRVGGKRWRFEATLDNLVDPSVLAARVTARPIEKARALQVGASLVIDPRAPLQIELAQQPYARLTDGAYNLLADTEPLTLVGLEAEYTFGDEVNGRVTPYTDLNTSMHGVGLHAGATAEGPLGKTEARLFGQLEYRLSSGGYAPTHMGTFYDVERYQAGLSWSNPDQANVHDRSTKLAGLVRGIYGGHGVLAQGGLRIKRLVQFKIGVSYRPGPDEVSLWWRATSNPIDRLHLGAVMLMRGLGGDYPGTNGVMAMAEGRYRITDTVYGMAQYARSWSLDALSGYYAVVQSFNISLGAAWSG
jgi:hypothetical protein